MTDETSNMGVSTDSNVVRSALRAELVARGHGVASDTAGARPDLYIVAPNDLANALFHFGDDAGEAAMSMYLSGGSWSAGMPPRFAVLPTTESISTSLEMLEQMHVVPLYYDVSDGRVTFSGLDQLLTEHVDA